MKTRYKYSLTFVVIHVLLTLFVFYELYQPNVPNGDLVLLFSPNIFIPLLLVDNLPDIFGHWSNLYWTTIFWAIVGFLIGLLVEKMKSKKSQVQ